LFSWHEQLRDSALALALDSDSVLYVDSPDAAMAVAAFDEARRQDIFARASHSCAICMCEAAGSDFAVMKDCGHAFCRACLNAHCTEKIK
jgi:hypothetical protein